MLRWLDSEKCEYPFTSPLLVQYAAPWEKKNGQSEPISADQAWSSLSLAIFPFIWFAAHKAVAALPLPPPRPAPVGTCLSKCTCNTNLVSHLCPSLCSLIWLPVPSLANNLLWETEETKTNLYVLTLLWICFWDFLASKFQKHTYQNAKHTQKYFWVPVFLLYKLKALIICEKVGAAAAALQATLNTKMLKASWQQTSWFLYCGRTDCQTEMLWAIRGSDLDSEGQRYRMYSNAIRVREYEDGSTSML
jgi:hypothetical protein